MDADSEIETDLRGLVESLSLIVIHIDRDLRYRFSNAAYERAFGIPRASLVGRRVEDNVDASTWQRIEPLLRRALAGERVRFEQTVRLFNGRSVRARTEYIPDTDDAGSVRGVYALLDDVTEYTSAIEMMRAVHGAIGRARLDYGETIESLLRLGRDFLGLELGIVSETRDGDYRIRFVEPAAADLSPGDVLPLEETYCDITLQTGDVLATERAGADPRLADHASYARFGLETYIGVPLVDRGQVFGTLNLAAARARAQPFSHLELEMVRLLGSAVERLLIQDRFEQGLFRSRLDMEQRALTDSLTGLPNRAHIFSEFEKLHEFHRAEGTLVSVALLDVDHFKRINDSFGHQVGDEVLTRVADTIGQAVRQGDLIGRVGGEEFLLLLPGVGAAEAAEAMERVRAAVAALDARSDGDTPVHVTASIGVAECVDDLSVDEIYSRADRALYRAKAAGRNRVELADSGD